MDHTTKLNNPLLWWIIGIIVFAGLTIVTTINKMYIVAIIFGIALIVCVIGISTKSKDSGEQNE